MAYIGQVTYGSVAVLLLALVPVSLTGTMDMPDSSEQYSNVSTSFSWMGTFMQENNQSVAYRCIFENFNPMELSLMQGNMKQDSYEQIVKEVVKIACRDHVMQFMTCLENGLSSGTTQIDKILYNLMDFPRLRALAKYLCGKIDTIADNADCMMSTVQNAIQNMQNQSRNDELTQCFMSTMAPLQGLFNRTEYDEETAREALGDMVKVNTCLRPMMEGCGGLGDVYAHTLAEMNSMYKGEKMPNSARPVTGQSSLLVTAVAISAVLLRLGYW